MEYIVYSGFSESRKIYTINLFLYRMPLGTFYCGKGEHTNFCDYDPFKEPCGIVGQANMA